MILPFAKLGTLLLRTLSKPLATQVKRRAASHPKFREAIVNFAQGYHKLNVSLQRQLYGVTSDIAVKPLNEEAAVSTAADLVGELIIFSVGTSVVIFEVSRSAISESRKEEARRQEREALKAKDAELERQVATLKQRMEAIETSLKGRGLSGWLHLPGTNPSASSSGAPDFNPQQDNAAAQAKANTSF